jgi:hypothetical protein
MMKGANHMFNKMIASVTALAAETGVTTDLDTFITTIKGALADLTTSNLAKVLVAGLGISAGLFLAWFGYRWVVRKVSGGIKKGRL